MFSPAPLHGGAVSLNHRVPTDPGTDFFLRDMRFHGARGQLQTRPNERAEAWRMICPGFGSNILSIAYIVPMRTFRVAS